MIIRSNTSGNTWPAIPSSSDAILLALQYQLEQSQWISAEQIQQNQFKQARQLLAHAVNTVPYYQNTIPKTLLDDTQPLDWSAWKNIPILERRNVQENSQDLISKAIPQDHLPIGAGM